MIVIGMGVFYWFLSSFTNPGPLKQEKEVQIIKGMNLKTISAKLEEKGMIRQDWVFEWMLRIRQDGDKLQAGQYRIPAYASMEDIYQKLKSGEVNIISVTVPEGLTSMEIYQLLRQESDLIEDHSHFSPEEGRYLPNTYHIKSGSSIYSVFERMKNAQKEYIDILWQEAQKKDLPFKTPEEMIILASIIEKETGKLEERALISSVFINRLKKGMRLESDPSVIYGLTKGKKLNRGLLKSELKQFSNWNTYLIKGLPETPICNPGLDSLKAAINPAKSDYLYFVANGKGGHFFSKKYKTHLENVRKWRKIERAHKTQ